MIAILDGADHLSERCDAIVDEFHERRDLGRFEDAIQRLTLDMAQATQVEI